MKDSSKNAVIIISILTIAVLGILLYQAQKTIVDQRNTIANQEAQINELKAENAKLSEISPEKIMDDAKDLIIKEGADILRNITNEALQEVEHRQQ